MSNSLYILQTHCIKYRINTSWCQLDKLSTHISKACLYFIKRNCVFDIIDINVLAYCRWSIELWTSSALCYIRCFLSLLKRLSLAVDGRFGILASHIAWNSLLVLLDAVRLYRVYRRLDTLPLYLYYEL